MNALRLTLISLCIVLAGLIGRVGADVQATTDDGRRVLLLDSGTWEVIEQETVDGFDFRKASWGMSREEVKAAEKLTVGEETKEWLAYEGTVSDFTVHIYYVFVGDRLVEPNTTSWTRTATRMTTSKTSTS
jgi:hypothetical protein